MKYFAKVLDQVVIKVIVADEEFFNTFIDDSPGRWIETFIDGTSRKNYASAGYVYDVDRDAFYRPQPYESWTLNEDTCQWEAPVAYPETGKHEWDNNNLSWIEAAPEV